jgi:uncharacterized protein involved in response to NO
MLSFICRGSSTRACLMHSLDFRDLRVLFPALGGFAIFLMLAWLAAFAGWLPLPAYFSAAHWHAHEMLFGFVAAVMTGTLLATMHARGARLPDAAQLAQLAALWSAGRVAMLLPLPGEIAAPIDLAFLPLLAWRVGPAALRARVVPNLGLTLIVLALFAANLLMHAAALGLWPAGAKVGLDVALYALLVLVTMLGGPLVADLTQRRIAAVEPGFTIQRWRLVEELAPALLLALLAGSLLMPGSRALALLAFAAAAVHGLRLALWQHPRVWDEPLLWTLHLSYACIPVGLLLTVPATLGLLPHALPTHVFTVGVMSSLTLGLMASAAPPEPGSASARWLNRAFIALALGAVVRAGLPILLPDWHALWIVLSGGLWIAAFAGFVVAMRGATGKR